MLPNQVPLLAPRRAWAASTRPAPSSSGWSERMTATSTSRNFGQHLEHLDICSLTDEIRDDDDPCITRSDFPPKIRKRFRGDRPPDDRACEYSASCIDMRADEVLIFGRSGCRQRMGRLDQSVLYQRARVIRQSPHHVLNG